MSRRVRSNNDWYQFLIFLVICAASQLSTAQPAPRDVVSADNNALESLSNSVRDLQEQVRELKSEVSTMRSDLQRERQHVEDASSLQGTPKHDLNEVGASQVSNQQKSSQREANQQESNQKQSGRSASIEEEYQLLTGKVDDQYQTKVESASKYRLRLSGIVLMNVVSNQGAVDSIDLPAIAYARPTGSSGGSFGATLRQSQVGLETFGPDIAGARTRANLQLDLAGGFVPGQNGINSGLMRLRTATMRFDWTNTSLVVGQDALFFSPNSPTSFAALAVPPLSYAGNLWSWVPQVTVEHRVQVGEDSKLLLQAGILDPVSGEVPGAAARPSSDYYRRAGPGEASRQPAYGARVAWTRDFFGQPFHIGVGGYYNRQDYGFNRKIQGWAGMTDFEIPLGNRISLAGKLYRGQALGGLYGGIGRSVLFNGDPSMPSTDLQALNDVGGWAQIKYRPSNKWEFNVASGVDNAFAGDVKYFAYAQAYGDPTLVRNQASFVNVIYRPKSDLLFSAEYRRLSTKSLYDGINDAGHLNLMMGVLF